jgi:hypothetical protein
MVVRLADRPRGQGRSDLDGKLSVGPRLAVWDTQKPLPATLMKYRAAQIQWEIEITPGPGKILVQLASDIAKTIRLLNPAHILCAVGSDPVSVKRNYGKTTIAHGKIEVSDRGIVTAGEKELRWLGK